MSQTCSVICCRIPVQNLKFGRAPQFHSDTCKNKSQPVRKGYQNMSKIGFYRTEYQNVQHFSSASGADALRALSAMVEGGTT
jgi:hypothetical protein